MAYNVYKNDMRKHMLLSRTQHRYANSGVSHIKKHLYKQDCVELYKINKGHWLFMYVD